MSVDEKTCASGIPFLGDHPHPSDLNSAWKELLAPEETLEVAASSVSSFTG